MTHYVQIDGAGCVVRSGSNAIVPDGFLTLPDGMTHIEAQSMMLIEGTWVARPTLPAPVTIDDTTTMTGAPAGTTCEVCDAEVGAVLATVTADAGVIVIELPDAGRYSLDFMPPLPFLPLTLTVVTP